MSPPLTRSFLADTSPLTRSFLAASPLQGTSRGEAEADKPCMEWAEADMPCMEWAEADMPCMELGGSG